MMPRYIDAHLLKKEFCDNCIDKICLFNDGKPCEECKIILSQSPADVAPVVHAHWVHKKNWGDKYVCSHCSFEFSTEQIGHYCKECGAKMDGDAK